MDPADPAEIVLIPTTLQPFLDRTLRVSVVLQRAGIDDLEVSLGSVRPKCSDGNRGAALCHCMVGSGKQKSVAPCQAVEPWFDRLALRCNDEILGHSRESIQDVLDQVSNRPKRITDRLVCIDFFHLPSGRWAGTLPILAVDKSFGTTVLQDEQPAVVQAAHQCLKRHRTRLNEVLS